MLMWFYYAADPSWLAKRTAKKMWNKLSHFFLVSAMTALVWEAGRPWVRPWDIFAPLPRDFSIFRPRDLGENGRTLQSGGFLHTIRWSSSSIVKRTKCEINDFSIVFSAKTVSWKQLTKTVSVHIAFLSVMRRFLASNSLAILMLIAIKNSQRESREGQGGRVHQSSFCPGACGWLSLALKAHHIRTVRYTDIPKISVLNQYRYIDTGYSTIPIYRNFGYTGIFRKPC